MQEDLNTVKNIVKSILETSERARNSDKYLIWLIFKEYTKSNISYGQFSLCPCFESIRRTREKLQAENNNLRGSEEIQKFREKNREEYKDYFSPNKPARFANSLSSSTLNETGQAGSGLRKGIEVEHIIKKGITLF